MFEGFLGVNPWTALFVLLNTLTIFFVARKFLFAPVMKMIADRQNEIDGMYTAAGESRTAAEALKAEYTAKLTDAQAESDRILKDAVVRAQRREEDIIRQANNEAQNIVDKAVADAALEKKKAINDAKDEISSISLAIAEKVVERSLAQADQQKLIDDFLKNLGDVL